MNTLEASIEILKIVTSAPSFKGLDLESRTDKILESFQKIYESIDSIVNQDKRDDSWDDTLSGTFDITLTGRTEAEVIDPTLKGRTEAKVIDPTLKGGKNIDMEGLDPTLKGG